MQKRALPSALSMVLRLQSPLRQYEIDAGLYREVPTPERRRRGEGSVLVLRIPALLEHRLLASLESLAAHR